MKAKESFLGSLTTLISGTVLAQLIGVLSIPIVAWFYAPAEFGRFTAIWVLGSTAGALFPLRYERLIAITKLESVARHISVVAYTCAATLLAVTIVILLSLRMFDVEVANSISGFELCSMLLLIGLFSVFQIRSQWLIRGHLFKRLAVSEVCGVLVTLVLQTIFGLIGWVDTHSLLCSAVFGRASQVAVSMVRLNQHCVPFSVYRARALAKKHKVYPTVSTPYSLVSVSVSRALVIVGAVYLSADIVGYLALAYRLTYLPISTITNAIRRVYITRLSRRLGSAGFEEETLTLVRIVALLLFPFYLFLGIGLPALISMYFPEKWHGAAQFIVLLLPGAGAMLLTAWFDRLYEVLGRQRSALLMELVSSIIIIFVYWFMLSQSHSAVVSVAIYSVLIATYNALWLMFSWKIANFPLTRYIVELFKILFFLVLLVLLWYWVKNHAIHLEYIAIGVSTIVCAVVGLLLIVNGKKLRFA